MVKVDEVVELVNDQQQAAEQEMNFWRKKGSFGKFHNVVKYIRDST